MPSARIHIFWQKRVRAEDTTTPWWYPSTTGGGEIREDRLVFPIPPGMTWRDELPVTLTSSEPSVVSRELSVEEKRPKTKKVLKAPRSKGGMWFRSEAIVEKAPKIEKPKVKIDPRLTAMARELRDRWSERAAAGLILEHQAKHDVRRLVDETMPSSQLALPALPAHPALPEAA